MGLIKSAHVPAAASPFSMRDVEQHAKSILIRAREQAEALLVEAQSEAEMLKQQAYVQGMDEGRREGRQQGMQDGAKAGAQQALAEHKQQLATLMTALTGAATQLDAARNELESEGLREVVALSIAVARRVTKRQGLLDPEVLTDNLREAMKLVSHAADVRVVIHPSQRSVMDAALPQLRLAWPQLKHVELIEDAALAPGGCRIATARGMIDADLDAQLDRVVNDLLPVSEETDAS